MPRPGITRPLWINIVVVGLAAVLLSNLAVGLTTFTRQYREGETAIDAAATRAERYVEANLKAQRAAEAGAALLLAGEPEIARMIATKAREELLARFTTNFPAVGSDAELARITFMDAAAIVVARIHLPQQFGDDTSKRRHMIVEAIRSGKMTVGYELGHDVMSLFTTAPVFDQAGHVAGVVDIGNDLNGRTLERLKSELNADFALYMAQDGKFVRFGSTFATDPPLTDAQLQAVVSGATLRERVQLGAKSHVVTGLALRDYAGAPIGVLEIAPDVTAIVTARTEVLWSIAGVSLGASAIAGAALLLMARRIARSISRLTSAMTRLADGDLEVVVPGQSRRDETGAMARAVAVLQQAGQEKLRLEHEAARRDAAEAETRRALAAERERAEAELSQVVDSLAGGLAQMADGDLACAIEQPFAPRYGKLRTDFNGAVERLRILVGRVAEAVAQIRSGANEIAATSQNLSLRSEQQATSIEQSAAALDQITAAVQRTADAGGDVRTLIEATSGDAEQSSAVVAQAVQAMGAIETSSQKIAQIIGVIDEIALQTNLLALNAGVEAARAGDAGRGFAVVAVEVRALAQRSAAAAKEIKGLIDTSNAQVRSGVDLVGSTGAALNKIGQQVKQISQSMGEIAALSREQSLTLSQVNTTVGQMDRFTQENVAMVEEAAAAARHLDGEAEALNELMAGFQLSRAPARPAQREPALLAG